MLLLISIMLNIQTAPNTFQAVLVTDGIRFYSIYTYKCGELNWMRLAAGIGFSASSSFFAEHPLSRTPNVNDIACINKDSSVWSNVVYTLHNISVTFNPPQIVSDIESVPYQVS